MLRFLDVTDSLHLHCFIALTWRLLEVRASRAIGLLGTGYGMLGGEPKHGLRRGGHTLHKSPITLFATPLLFRAVHLMRCTTLIPHLTQGIAAIMALVLLLLTYCYCLRTATAYVLLLLLLALCFFPVIAYVSVTA